MKNTKQILSVMLLIGVPAIAQASARNDSDQPPVKESSATERIQRDATLSKRQFLAHLGKIVDLAKNDNAVPQQSAKGSNEVQRDEKGQLHFTIRTDLLGSFTVNLVRAIAPLIECGNELKWQIDEECAEKLRETLLAVMQGENITRDRLYLRRKWALQCIEGFDSKMRYFTPEVQELWKGYAEELRAICSRKSFPECLNELAKCFRDSYFVLNPSVEVCQAWVSLINETRDRVWEMRKFRVSGAVTGDEFRNLMDAFSQVFPVYYGSQISAKKKARRDLLCKAGVFNAFMDLVVAIRPVMHLTIDRDISGAVVLQNPKTRETVNMVFSKIDKCYECSLQNFFAPEERNTPRVKQMMTEKCHDGGDWSEILLTDELYEWCTRGTGEVQEVMRSSWVRWLLDEMANVIEEQEQQDKNDDSSGDNA